MTSFNIHLVSDSTGETVEHVARACLVQFSEIDAIEHVWTMIRSEEQIQKIESYCSILYSDLKTIEKFGGGSARCMMAEIFLPLKK